MNAEQPSPLLAAGGEVTPGEHWTVEVAGLEINLDTVIGTLVAAIVVCGLGLWAARRATAGRPTALQLTFEALVGWVQGQVKEGMGRHAPAGLVAFAVTLFAFILTANWLGLLPTHEWVPSPTADVNLVYAMTIVVFVWLNVWAIRRSPKHYVKHWVEPYAFLAPIELVTLYVSRPLSLALRLVGNVLSGGIMISVIAMLPIYVSWLPMAGWKLFEMFVGVIQALIFALLTIIYFSGYVSEKEKAS
ncbi:ATP synthase subunit a [Pseudonocardia sulfidoxydans NBRC 16205]|uniref:ATP synthase subunit a n=1 Tax=Pseudonocardia sulfidoxydans NBRC 16205 TaxID=1223511 RepID=A0A511DH60_9PSEU|nr:F0F1 ATP synthase subunit A [Pseudonocardia sulfidoxydans]GEL23094.1 ATP synthase subunit a [Pseudonocardia sulfidoxydans NBRC 16205]